MTGGTDRSNRRRTVPVEPPIRVEVFASHYSLTWKADGLGRVLDTVRGIDAIAASTRVIVDTTTTPGRERVPLEEVDADDDTTRYLRVEPSAPWTCSWERRTWPVALLSGTPGPALARTMHRGTTDCSGWPQEALDTLEQLRTSVR